MSSEEAQQPRVEEWRKELMETQRYLEEQQKTLNAQLLAGQNAVEDTFKNTFRGFLTIVIAFLVGSGILSAATLYNFFQFLDRRIQYTLEEVDQRLGEREDRLSDTIESRLSSAENRLEVTLQQEIANLQERVVELEARLEEVTP